MKPLTLFAEPVGDRDTHLGEVKLAGVLAMKTQLVEVPSAFETGHATFDDQQ